MKDNSSNRIALDLKNIVRVFKTGDSELRVLDGADLTVARGETVALMAPSGTGKSTLLQIAGLLDTPQSGDIYVAAEKLDLKNDALKSAVRARDIGFVYQFHHLLGDFTAQENVLLPQLAIGRSRSEGLKRAQDLLARVGLAHKADSLPGEMSGGERQRTAIARAVANTPAVLLADEPTGNLDAQTGDFVFDMLLDLIRQSGIGALIATHNYDLAKKMDRIITLKDGRVVPF